MLITLLDLEREPVRFDLELPPGAIDYGEDAKQVGNLAVQGQAELLREHRGAEGNRSRHPRAGGVVAEILRLRVRGVSNR